MNSAATAFPLQSRSRFRIAARSVTVFLIALTFSGICPAAKIKIKRTGKIYEGTVREITDTEISILTAKGIGLRMSRSSAEVLEWPGVLEAPENFLLGEALVEEARKLMEAGDYPNAIRKYEQARNRFETIKPGADRYFGRKSKKYHSEAGRLIESECEPKLTECRRLQKEKEERIRIAGDREKMERGIGDFNKGLRAYLNVFATGSDEIFAPRSSADMRDALLNARGLCESGISSLTVEPDSSEYLKALGSFRKLQELEKAGAKLFELTQTRAESPSETALPEISVLLRQLQQAVNKVSGIGIEVTEEVSGIHSSLEARGEKVKNLADVNLQLKVAEVHLSEAESHFKSGSFRLGHQVSQDTLSVLNQIDKSFLTGPRAALHSKLLKKFGEIDVGPEKLAGQLPSEINPENFNEAERIGRLLKSNFPEAPETTRAEDLVADSLLERGRELEELGDEDGALSLYRKIGRDYPESLQASASQDRTRSINSWKRYRLFGGIGFIAVLLGVGLAGDIHGRRCRKNLRMSLFDRASVILANTMRHFESREGASIFLWVLIAVPFFVLLCLFTLVLFVITLLYLPFFIVMRLVHWVSLIYRGIVYQCPYQDDGTWSRFRNPIHVCECGEAYPDLRPSFYGLFHHTCRKTEGHADGGFVKLPTLDLNGRNDLPRLCAGCRRPLIHKAGYEMPVSPVALVGSPNSGKTVFLRQMIEDFRERYGSKPKNRIELDSEADRKEHDNIIEDLSWGDLPQKTAEVHRAMGLIMVIPKLRVRCLMHLFDSPGERFGVMERFGKMQALQFLRGIVLLVDPFAPDLLSDKATELGQNAAATSIALGTIVNNLINGINSLHLSDPRQQCQIPVAVVISKIDQLNPAEYPLFANVKAGQPAKANLTGRVVRDALVKMGGEQTLEKLENKFTDCKYFACSALGGSPSDLESSTRPDSSPAQSATTPQNRGDRMFVPVGVTEPMLFLIGHKHFKRRRLFS